jgi:uncharacterized protein (TIGR02246 family)
MHRTSLLTGFAVPALLLAACATTEVEPAETPEPQVAAVPAPTAAPAETPADASAVAGMTSAPPAEIAPVHAQFGAAWNGKDPQAVAAFFAEDAVVTNEEGQTLNGREDIQQSWLDSAVPTMSQLEATPESFEMMGDRITETGRYSFLSTTAEETGTLSGRYEQVWQRQPDGEWKIAAWRSWSQQ